LQQAVGQSLFAVLCSQFQLTTICSQSGAAFVQARFQHRPVFARVFAVRQDTDNINDGKPPFGVIIVPDGTHFLIIEKPY
jgi:hypothetical protein